ncbi:hypothetical protein D920_00284, partial [Enterococcus faecalis 13-SD-W-01]
CWKQKIWKVLPIVVIDDENVKTGAYLTVEELEKLTDIGMIVQRDNDQITQP